MADATMQNRATVKEFMEIYVCRAGYGANWPFNGKFGIATKIVIEDHVQLSATEIGTKDSSDT